MNTLELEKEIDKLCLSEKLILVEDIWDKIAKDNQTPPLADWQREELDKRYDSYKNGKQSLHDWKKVHAELRVKYK